VQEVQKIVEMIEESIPRNDPDELQELTRQLKRQIASSFSHHPAG
jgi:hypothetical protein